MIVELGHFALVLALVTALIQASLPLIGAARRDAALIRLGASGASAQFLLLTVAFGVLIHAYIVSDFSVQNVYQNSHTQKPLLYKISGAWGNHEGSLLMWVWMLSLYGGAVAWFGQRLPATFRARVLAVQAMIGVGFLAFMLFTSNPFLRLDPAPMDGQGLNPVLQDPGLAFHPPMLYLGYVGFSMAFAFAIAALIEGRVDPSWARWVRPWTLVAWVALTIGIALGSWWAYYELGWGGWWFWDPVENASFMPWLAGTALVHSAIVVEKRDALKAWTILLAILTFGLCLLGTFLVRSGVLTSVHAFATDPTRGIFILMLLLIAVGGALALYAWRAPTMQGGGAFAPVSREGSLLANNLLMAAGCGVVFLGTLYPLFLDAFGGPKISVGPPYFQATFVPLMVPVLLLIPIGTMMAWKRGNWRQISTRLRLAAAVALLAGLGTLVLERSVIDGFAAALGVALAVWVIAGAIADLAQRVGLPDVSMERAWRRARGLPRGAYGMAIAHAGLGVFLLGATASEAWQGERLATMAPGETVELAGYGFTLARVERSEGPNYVAQRGVFDVSHRGAPLTTMMPEKRFYQAEGQQTTEAAIHSTLLRDLYIVLGEVEEGRIGVRVYHNPLVMWLWGGVILTGLGGLVALSDRKKRIGVPKRLTPRPDDDGRSVGDAAGERALGAVRI